MSTTTGSPRTSGSARRPGRGASRRRRWPILLVAALLVAGLVIAAVALLNGTRSGGAAPTGEVSGSGPIVGGDLHTVAAIGGSLYLGGHMAAAVSDDGGRTWSDIPSLQNADAMGWAATGDSLLVGGHPGLFRSSDGGATFEKAETAFADVHALGGSGDTLFLASPEAGLLASSDGGVTWQVRNAQVGQSFMGTILVDPSDPNRLLAPDMASGLATSRDGGATWTSLGGPMGAMAAAWNPADTDQIIAVGMNGGAASADGGASWKEIALPAGTSAVSYSEDGGTVYAGVLQGVQAYAYSSTDGGATWNPTS